MRQIVFYLHNMDGPMTLRRSLPLIYFRFNDGTTIRTWKNPLQVEHVFVADNEGQCLYAGFVGWLHAEDLRNTLEDIKKQFIPVFAKNSLVGWG